MFLKKYIKWKEKDLLTGFTNFGFQLFVFFILAFISFYISYSFAWVIFSERDISRAIDWLNGNFYWPGPEMSGGNNLPGPFFYFLLFPAFSIGDNIYSQVALWTVIWQALTYTVAFAFIKSILSHKESLLFFLIPFILNIDSFNYSQILNPEFAVLFHVLTLIGLYYWKEKRNSFYLYLTSFVIALGIQIHLLVGLHIITVFLFYITDTEKRIKLKSVLFFLFLSLSPLLVYSVLKYSQFFKTSGIYYDTYSFYLLKQIFSEDSLKHIKQVITPFIPFFVFLFSLSLWQNKKTKKYFINQSTKNLFIITAIPFLLTILAAKNNWYLLFIPVFSLIFISKWMDDFMPKKSTKRLLFLLSYSFLTPIYVLFFNYKRLTGLETYKLFNIENKLAVLVFLLAFFILVITSIPWKRKDFYRILLLCFCIFLSAPISALFTFQKNKNPLINKKFSRVLPKHQELKPLLEKIYLETSWPPKLAMQKIMNIGMYTCRSLLADYARAKENIKPDKLTGFSNEKPQGYFIIQHLEKFIRWEQEDWKNYLSESSLLSHLLQKEIKEDKIFIKNPELYGSFWLIPYNTTESSLFPEGFHNIGQAYYWEDPGWLKTCNKTQKFQNEKGLFYCETDTGHLQRAGVNIKFSKKAKNNKLSLNIDFIGPALGVSCAHTNLDGSMLWQDIQISLECNKKNYQWNLPDIGNLNRTFNHSSIEEMSKMFLAPLKINIPIEKCKKTDIEKIKLTFTKVRMLSSNTKTKSVIWELN